MRRWPVLVLVSVFLVAGCGIDDAKLTDAPANTASSTTSTTLGTASTGTAPPPTGTEPGQTGSAADKLLTEGDLGSDWQGTTSGGGATGILSAAPCLDTSSPTDPEDHAEAVFAQTTSGAVLLQRVDVYSSEDDARSAIDAVRSALAACDNPVVDVKDLDLPDHGDEQVGARIEIGGGSAGTIVLVAVRVGDSVTILTTLDLQGELDLAPIVDAAAARL